MELCTVSCKAVMFFSQRCCKISCIILTCIIYTLSLFLEYWSMLCGALCLCVCAYVYYADAYITEYHKHIKSLLS